MMTKLKQLLKKKTFSYLVNSFVAVAAVLLIFDPATKALMIQGLMKAGLFQPEITENIKRVAEPLPEVSFQNNKGDVVDLPSLKGKVIFINFWATWCPPCIAEMPAIDKLYEKLKDNKNIAFIIVDADHNFSKSAPFMSVHHFTMPLFKATSQIPQSLLGNAIPTTTIFDKTGAVVFHQEGGADYGNPKVLAYLKQLANK